MPWLIARRGIARKHSGGSAQDFAEVVRVPGSLFPAHLEAGLGRGGAHEVEPHVADNGHVLGAMSGAQPVEIVVEDDVEHPVQSVLDAPMRPHGTGEGGRIELGRAQVVAPLGGGVGPAFDDALDHADHGKAREAWLVGIAAVGEQPSDIVADRMPALLDATVVTVRRRVPRGDLGLRIAKEALDLGVQQRVVGLERQRSRRRHR